MHLVIKTIDELQKVIWTGKKLKVDKIVVTNSDRVNEMWIFILKIWKSSRSAISIKLGFTEIFKYGFAFAKTYRFFLFFHPTRHLWDGSVYRRILLEVRQFFCKVNWHRLRWVEGPSPEWKFCRHRVFLFSLQTKFPTISLLYFLYFQTADRPSGDRKRRNMCSISFYFAFQHVT